MSRSKRVTCIAGMVMCGAVWAGDALQVLVRSKTISDLGIHMGALPQVPGSPITPDDEVEAGPQPSSPSTPGSARSIVDSRTGDRLVRHHREPSSPPIFPSIPSVMMGASPAVQQPIPRPHSSMSRRFAAGAGLVRSRSGGAMSTSK